MNTRQSASARRVRMVARLHRFLCCIGFHAWEVQMLIFTGRARCRRCAATGIYTWDGIIGVQRAPESPYSDSIERRDIRR